VIHESGLADPGLAPDHQHRALAALHVAQHLLEQLELGGSAQQHRRTARGHGATKLTLGPVAR
jgi:hypothetical protein